MTTKTKKKKKTSTTRKLQQQLFIHNMKKSAIKLMAERKSGHEHAQMPRLAKRRSDYNTRKRCVTSFSCCLLHYIFTLEVICSCYINVENLIYSNLEVDLNTLK